MDNRVTKAALIAEARKLGAGATHNKDAYVRFLTSIVLAATVGEVKIGKPGSDDSVEIAAAHVRATTIGAKYDPKKPAHQILASKIRAMIRFANWCEEHVPEKDPAEILSDMARERAKASENHAIYDASNCVLAFARAQAKAETLLSRDEVQELCKIPDNNESATAAQWWHRIYKQALKLNAGTLPHCPEQDDGVEMAVLLTACEKRLKIRRK
jgi:hypothetical protein